MHEVLEGNEHEGHEKSPLTLPVTVTLAILAVFIAISTLMGGGASKEEILLQSQEADQWAFFQAKNDGLRIAQSAVVLLSTLAPVDKEAAAAAREKYEREVERYTEEKAEAQTEAQKLRAERLLTERRGHRYEAAEVILEIGLILCTFTLLTNRKAFWFSGIVLGAIGIVVGLSAILVH
ncbi:MAG: DUF4337 domain-containing protein [Candidatus Acidiferrum sp.]